MILLPLLVALSMPAAKEPRLVYTLHFDSTNLDRISVELRVRGAPHSLQIAAHAHSEYDDKYWRYVEDFKATSADGASIQTSRIDSVRWQLNNKAGDVVVSYRVKFPHDPLPRPAWHPFLSASGGLIGGPQSFLYPIGLENALTSVKLDIPSNWKVGTGLTIVRPREFFARDVFEIMESPMLVGRLSEWNFRVRNVPHRILYWKLPNGAQFDTTAFIRGIETYVSETMNFFGRAPYREYAFLFQDGAFTGGLEHPNSLTLGAPSEQLAKDPLFTMEEIAHEYFHTWNLMAIKPAEYREVDYKIQPPVAELWFSEGLTIFYADLLRRRIGLPTDDSSRVEHLRKLIERYYSSPGLSRFSAEHVSRVAYNASPDALGDYAASTHLHGELIGVMLDLQIRDATNGTKSMDDVMRLMFDRFSQRKFTSRDVQRVVDDVCMCSSASIFDGSVFNAGEIDFNRYLATIGLKAIVTSGPAVNDKGQPQGDVRVWAYERGGQLKLRVSDPASIWAKAGMHTGDNIMSVNGSVVRTWPEFRPYLARLEIGDSISLTVRRGNQTIERTVKVTGYERPRVTIERIARSTPRQNKLLRDWIAGSVTASAPGSAPRAARQLQ